MGMSLDLATSDKVRMQFSTLSLWSRVSQEHWETLNVAPRS